MSGSAPVGNGPRANPVQNRPVNPPAPDVAKGSRTTPPPTARPMGYATADSFESRPRAAQNMAPGAAAPGSQPPQQYQDINAGEGFSWSDAVGFAADIAGIFDPTPISDGISGLVSLGKGDLLGAGLSVGSMIPYLGDAVAKPAKFAKKVADVFPGLAKLAADPDRLVRMLKLLGPHASDPAKVNNTLKALNNLATGAEAAYKANPSWLAKAQKIGLPTDGPVPFVPPKGWNPSNPTRTQDGKGYIDAFGNEWRKGPSRTAGEPYEWDVIPRQKDSGLANLSRDGSHVNVSLKGEVTHR